jgi:thiamine-phosphate pyrophosphorylase
MTKPIICYVTDRKALVAANPAEAFRESISAAIGCGADWVQIREKDLHARELSVLARYAVKIANLARRARIFVNDRLDVALASAAAGVHLGFHSPPARDVVRWCRGGEAPEGFQIGVSCHSLNEARDAEAAGVNYIFFGPVFETPSKKAYGLPQGLVSLESVCKAIRIPVIAIGGVDESSAPSCLGAGAAGIAAIRMFQQKADPQLLRDAIARLHESADTR